MTENTRLIILPYSAFSDGKAMIIYLEKLVMEAILITRNVFEYINIFDIWLWLWNEQRIVLLTTEFNYSLIVLYDINVWFYNRSMLFYRQSVYGIRLEVKTGLLISYQYKNQIGNSWVLQAWN